MVEHKVLFVGTVWLAIFLFSLVLFPNISLSMSIANEILFLFFFGVIYCASDATRKLKTLQDNEKLATIILSDFEAIKRDLNAVIPVIGMVAAMGVAAMVLKIVAVPLPQTGIILVGMTIEAVTTVLFALVYWWFLFFLLGRFSINKAANWASYVSAVPFLVGSYLTVIIAIFFNLNTIEDFAAAFLPFIFVYYWFDRAMPNYGLVAKRPLKEELEIVNEQIEKAKKESRNPFLRERKERLVNESLKLDLRKTQIKSAIGWVSPSNERICKLERDYRDFNERMDSLKQYYLQKLKNVTEQEVGLLINEDMVLLKRNTSFDYSLLSCLSSIRDPVLKEQMIYLLSLFEVAGNTKFPGLVEIDFEKYQRQREITAIEEAGHDNIPLLCQNFDRKHLEEFTPAIIQYQLECYKQAVIFRQIRRYPSSLMITEYEQNSSDLSSSINVLQEKIKQRIKDYKILEAECPECYVVRGFRSFRGVLGLSALEDSLNATTMAAVSLSALMRQIEENRNIMRIQGLT
jgi:hypothetical protein